MLKRNVLVNGISSTDTIEDGKARDEKATDLIGNIDNFTENSALKITDLAKSYEYIDQWGDSFRDAPVFSSEYR